MQFTKMQALGNDYVYVNCFEETIREPERLARAVSDRHYGIGSDGLILIGPSDCADCRMEIYNGDGSRGAMCGNGIRCVAKYVYETGIRRKTCLSVETDSGIRTVYCLVKGERVENVRVQMGIPSVGREEELELPGGTVRFVTVQIGNPHAVLFMEENLHHHYIEETAFTKQKLAGALPGSTETDRYIRETGYRLEHHGRFPGGTNVEFVWLTENGGLNMRVWERGSGETLACGTGACAAAAAAMTLGRSRRQVTVRLPGGTLEVWWPKRNASMYLTGTAKTVFSGEFQPEDLTFYKEPG